MDKFNISSLPTANSINFTDILVLDEKDTEITKQISFGNFIKDINKEIQESIDSLQLSNDIVDFQFKVFKSLPYSFSEMKNNIFVTDENRNNNYLLYNEYNRNPTWYDASNENGNFRKIYNRLVQLKNEKTTQYGTGLEIHTTSELYDDYSWVINTANHTFRTPFLFGVEDSPLEKQTVDGDNSYETAIYLPTNIISYTSNRAGQLYVTTIDQRRSQGKVDFYLAGKKSGADILYAQSSRVRISDFHNNEIIYNDTYNTSYLLGINGADIPRNDIERPLAEILNAQILIHKNHLVPMTRGQTIKIDVLDISPNLSVENRIDSIVVSIRFEPFYLRTNYKIGIFVGGII